MFNPMWIEAWGGKGGNTDTNNDKNNKGGTGGYAQTTVSVSEIMNINNGSTEIFYFLGAQGQTGPKRCGGAGGSATIVSLDDLSTAPSDNPPPALLLIAGVF